jgi:hypothetical protein
MTNTNRTRKGIAHVVPMITVKGTRERLRSAGELPSGDRDQLIELNKKVLEREIAAC